MNSISAHAPGGKFNVCRKCFGPHLHHPDTVGKWQEVKEYSRVIRKTFSTSRIRVSAVGDIHTCTVYRVVMTYTYTRLCTYIHVCVEGPTTDKGRIWDPYFPSQIGVRKNYC